MVSLLNNYSWLSLSPEYHSWLYRCPLPVSPRRNTAVKSAAQYPGTHLSTKQQWLPKCDCSVFSTQCLCIADQPWWMLGYCSAIASGSLRILYRVLQGRSQHLYTIWQQAPKHCMCAVRLLLKGQFLVQDYNDVGETVVHGDHNSLNWLD